MLNSSTRMSFHRVTISLLLNFSFLSPPLCYREHRTLTCVVTPPQVVAQQYEELKYDLRCRMKERLKKMIELERRMFARFAHSMVALVGILFMKKCLNTPEYLPSESVMCQRNQCDYFSEFSFFIVANKQS